MHVAGGEWDKRHSYRCHRFGQKKVHCRFVEKDKGGRATRPPLQPHRMNVGESPSFAATQDECGRVAHTPIAVYYTRRVQWLKQAPQNREPLPLRCNDQSLQSRLFH